MKTTENQLILDFMAIDPGRSKCGMARFVAGLPVEQGVVSPEELVSRLTRKPEKLLVVGDRTGAEALLTRLFPAGPPVGTQVLLVDETTPAKRGGVATEENAPAGGVLRWLQYPAKPYDDYVAVILANDILPVPMGLNLGGKADLIKINNSW